MKRRPTRPTTRRAAPPQYKDLADYIAQTGDTQAHIAARVGTSQAVISRILNRGSVPRALLAMRLAEYAHIPLDSFTRAFVATRRAVA
jgi:transcriptional regulator with XRE-family HTH domain